jgi:hypothetical protein
MLHWSNCRFNADANNGHGFAILMASVGALRASRFGGALNDRFFWAPPATHGQ